MKPIRMEETLGFDHWNRIRRIIRPAIIREKDRRRLPVGSHLTFLFENVQTLWYQIEEMIRTERLTDATAIQHEIDTYNELIPAQGELSATLLIEYSEARERDAALQRLVGLERNIVLKVGERSAPLKFDERQMDPHRISAVQFVKFDLKGIEPEQFLALADAGKVSVEVNHPNLAASAAVCGTIAAALADDLRPEVAQA